MKWKKPKEKWSSKKKVLVSFICTFSVLIILAGAVFGYAKLTLSKIDRKAMPTALDDLGITEEVEAESEKSQVTNIALFGLDTRGNDDSGRSDALMILSVDKKYNKIKLTSIARDTYVPIEGHGKTKINHAYAYGGSELAVKTVNSNFDMDIKDFVSVNFGQLADIIDYVGGVTVNVTSAEQQNANKYIESNKKITKTGDVHLNGEQAVAYARVRKVGGDTQRTERQREVLTDLFNNVKKMNKTKYPALINKVLSECQTSLTDNEMMTMGLWAVTSNPELETLGLPNKECDSTGKIIDGVWYYVYDIDNATDIIHRYIYDDIQSGEEDKNSEDEDNTNT